MSDERPIVVYTAVTNNYDTVKPPPRTLGNNVDCVAFVDDQYAQLGPWQYRPVHNEFKDPNRNAKIHKILPHLYFPDKEYSLWIDGSISIIFQQPMQLMIDRYLGKHDLALFPHPVRNCIYQEGCICLHWNLDNKDIIRNQMYRYTREGYPVNNGLNECTVLLRRHTQPMIDFCELWWKEIQSGSRRDQLSFNYIRWKTGLKVRLFEGTLFFKENNMFCRYRHRRR